MLVVRLGQRQLRCEQKARTPLAAATDAEWGPRGGGDDADVGVDVSTARAAVSVVGSVKQSIDV